MDNRKNNKYVQLASNKSVPISNPRTDQCNGQDFQEDEEEGSNSPNSINNNIEMTHINNDNNNIDYSNIANSNSTTIRMDIKTLETWKLLLFSLFILNIVILSIDIYFRSYSTIQIHNNNLKKSFYAKNIAFGILNIY